MTLREALSEVSALGFDGELECDSAFLTALERSKRQLFSERGVTGEFIIPPAFRAPETLVPIYRHEAGDSRTFSLSGKAYSFFVSGKGRYTVVDGAERTTRSFDATRERIAGFIKSRGSIIFEGEYAFTVTALACFSVLHGDSVSDIPDGSAVVRLDMRKLVPDFHSFLSPAKDMTGRIIPGIRLEEAYAYIPSDYTGEARISYRRTPAVTPPENMDSVIDLPTGCEHLLPLLIASYVYVDSFPDRAEYYGALYREASAAEMKNRVRVADTLYRDTNGWA